MPVKFAIIGCGKIAQRHALHANHFGELVAVCDIVPDKADALAQLYNCTSFHSISEMLAANLEIDVAVICTPNGLHATNAIQAFNNHLHVLCEKPMAISSIDCVAMMHAAEKNNKQLFIVKQNRFNPPVMAVKALLDKKQLGKIYSAQLNCFWNRNAAYYNNSWHGTATMDGGTLYTQFSHFIDLLYWFFGDVKQIQAMLSNTAHRGMIAFEDTGIINFSFANNVTVGMHYSVNSFKQNMEGSLTIFAEKGTVKIGGAYLDKIEYQLSDTCVIEDLPASKPANDYGSYTGSMSNHDKVYDNLVKVLLHNDSAYANAFDGLKTVEIIERVYTTATYIDP